TLWLTGRRVHAGHQEGVSVIPGLGRRHGVSQRDSHLPRRPHALWRGQGLRPRPRGPPLRHRRDDRNQAPRPESVLTRVLSPHHPDVLRAFRRCSPADSAAGSSAPPGSHAAPPALVKAETVPISFLPTNYLKYFSRSSGRSSL